METIHDWHYRIVVSQCIQSYSAKSDWGSRRFHRPQDAHNIVFTMELTVIAPFSSSHVRTPFCMASFYLRDCELVRSETEKSIIRTLYKYVSELLSKVPFWRLNGACDQWRVCGGHDCRWRRDVGCRCLHYSISDFSDDVLCFGLASDTRCDYSIATTCNCDKLCGSCRTSEF